MNILALDLGTKTGWCVLNTGTQELRAGTWNLAKTANFDKYKKIWNPRYYDPRIAALLVCLLSISQVYEIHRTVFEDVQFVVSQAQAHLWASYRGALWAWCAMQMDDSMQVCSLHTGGVKKFATGCGNATKEMMLERLQKTAIGAAWGLPEKLDDNTVDAIWLAFWGERITP